MHSIETTRRVVFLAASALLLVMGACSRTPSPTAMPSSSPTTPQKSATIQTYLTEFSIRAEPSSAKAGMVEFVAHNEGTVEHELVVVKTSLAPDQLPVGEDDTVKEGGPVEVIGEIEPDELSPSATASTTLELQAGSYVLICNIPQHYSSGMRTAFNVTA